jgi:hypothetical protein
VADIFKEVDEDLRRENLEKLWKKYGKAILGLAFAGVLGVAGTQAWRYYDRQQREAQSDRFAAALATAHGGDPAGAAAALSELSDPGGGGYGGLAALERARLLAESGDLDGAVALWDRVAADGALGPAFRSVATLLSVMHQIERADSAALSARLMPLAAADQPFRGSAREMMAVLALRNGDKAAAAELYAQISDDREMPTGLRARAAQMLAALKD